jgi:hypothetical protein
MYPPDPATPQQGPTPTPLGPDPATAFVPSRRRRKPGGCLPWVLLIAVMSTGYAVWKFPTLKAEAELGVSYAARIGCSCRYIEGRDIDSCETDFAPGMELISLTDDPETKSVIGRAPLLASRTARYAGASGCMLMPPE